MSILDFMGELNNRTLRRNIQEINEGIKRRVSPKKNRGPSVYSRDWDILILLDTCRPDTFKEVGIPLLENDGIQIRDFYTVTSNASQSREWMERTFIENYCLDVSQTAYITANVYSGKVFDGKERRHPFAKFVELWRTNWDEQFGTVRAEDVVDAALPYVGTERPTEKVIVHLMQPHFPSIADPVTEQQQPIEADYTGQNITFAWNKLQDREISEERIRESYRNNLRYALEEVVELIDHAEGTVVLSSDHGQAFGEWGIYGHPPSTATKQVLEVPWVVVKERAKPAELDEETAESVEDKLAALGYK